MALQKLTLAIFLLKTLPALADAPADDWTKQKCNLYQSAFQDALAFLGPDGISDVFMSQNNDFIAADCVGAGYVCPVSRQELELANLLTIMTMNEGMASTFVPFRCPPSE